MFYCLTKDNQIITQECKPYQNILNGFYFVIDWFEGKYTEIKIKKFSENVYDLIEKGDLIEYRYHDTNTFVISKVVLVDEYEIMTRGYVHCEEKIRAIYKKDFKGNYILVWNNECEEE